MEFKIGKLAEKTGVNVDTLRYYERQGLFKPHERKQNGYRIYTDESIKQIMFIKKAQSLGFSLSEIKQLLQFNYQPGACNEIKEILKNKSGQYGKYLAEIAHVKRTLDVMEARCTPEQENRQFLDYLFADKNVDASELVVCRHTYLFETGDWKLTGTVAQENADSVEIEGIVSVQHNDGMWNVSREFTIADGSNADINFFIPAIPLERDVTKFVADCSTFGEVIGSILFAGDNIFKNYEMTEHGFKAHEHMKKLSSEMYESSGVVSNGEKAILKWDYKLKKLNEHFMTTH